MRPCSVVVTCSFEEDLDWEPRLGVFVDLVVFDDVDLVVFDDVANGGVGLFKTVEALRGTFFSQLVWS